MHVAPPAAPVAAPSMPSAAPPRVDAPAPGQAAPAGAAAAAGELTLRPGGVPEGGPESPAGDVWRRYGRTLLTIPGAWAVSLPPGEDPPVILRMVDEGAADAAVRLLEGTLEGVTLQVSIGRSNEPHTPPAGPVNGGDLVRAAAALPGVWDYRYASTPPGADLAVTLRTIDRATVERLDPLLRDVLVVGHWPNGAEQRIRLYWSAGVPAHG